MSSFEARRRTIGGLALLAAAVLTSCKVKVETPVPPEFAAGISYTNYRVRSVPWSIHVARVSRVRHDLELHSTHARRAALGLETLSSQVKSVPPELGTAIAAVNGDFYVRERAYAGDSRGLQLLEGELISAPVGGVSFWMDASGLPHATNIVSLLKVTWPDGTSTPFGLNEQLTNHSMVLYTPAIGTSTHTTNGLELVLEPAGEGPWLPLRIGTNITARVQAVRARPNSPLNTNTMVLAIGPTLLGRVPTVQTGAVLKISTETSPDLYGVKTAISGGPLLVHERQRQSWSQPAATSTDGTLPYAIRSMRERHPRTALGWDDQYYYLVEVDGRQKKLSDGMTLNELADFLIGMGCKEAVNFDGGGSAMFWCNGRVVNSPCDKKEREIANALVVLRKPALRQEAALNASGH